MEKDFDELTIADDYMLVNTLERDARNDGWKAGISHKALPKANSSVLQKVRTKKHLKQHEY